MDKGDDRLLLFADLPVDVPACICTCACMYQYACMYVYMHGQAGRQTTPPGGPETLLVNLVPEVDRSVPPTAEVLKL